MTAVRTERERPAEPEVDPVLKALWELARQAEADGKAVGRLPPAEGPRFRRD